MKYYATLNSENICNGISQLNDEVVADNLIELASYDTSVLGKMWTGSEWVDNPNPPEPQEKPVTLEDLQAQIKELQSQSTQSSEQINEIYAAQAGDTVVKSELDAAYREGVNSYAG